MERPNRIPARIREMEEVLDAKGIARCDLMDAAHSHKNQWSRWKSGRVSPRVIIWDAVEAAFTEMTTESGGATSTSPEVPA